MKKSITKLSFGLSPKLHVYQDSLGNGNGLGNIFKVISEMFKLLTVSMYS